jgi:hypothetical protein
LDKIDAGDFEETVLYEYSYSLYEYSYSLSKSPASGDIQQVTRIG